MGKGGQPAYTSPVDTDTAIMSWWIDDLEVCQLRIVLREEAVSAWLVGVSKQCFHFYRKSSECMGGKYRVYCSAAWASVDPTCDSLCALTRGDNLPCVIKTDYTRNVEVLDVLSKERPRAGVECAEEALGGVERTV